MTTIPDTKGVGFPFGPGPDGFPQVAEGVDVIENSLRTVILTGSGERVMRPNLGSDIYGFTFDNLSPITLARLSQAAKAAIEANEPRVKVIDVTARQSIKPGQVRVLVTYRVSGETRETEVEVP